MQSTTIIILAVYIVGLILFGYFAMVRPGKKQKKARAELLQNMKPGDLILTTSGFYGEVVAVHEDTVIVEFGDNKNCRIPMKKDAIEQIEPSASDVYAGDNTKK